MKFVTTLDRDEGGIWIAACLEIRAEGGLPFTIETQQVEVALGWLR